MWLEYPTPQWLKDIQGFAGGPYAPAVLIAAAIAVIALLFLAAVRLALRERRISWRRVLGSVTALGLCWAILVHHLGAPPDDYPGPGDHCPAGSTYVSDWMPGRSFLNDGQAVQWFGSTEIASCGGVLHAGMSAVLYPEPAPEFRPEPAPEFRPEPAPEFRPEPAPEFRPGVPPSET